jgi:outer membrane protein assembly factor BamE (lipoprotein component of BamABCDE complex)
MKFGASKFAVAVAGALLLAGCAGVRAHKGSVIDPQLASAIQVGVDNKASVEKTLGRPTFTGEFTPNYWYYVSRDTHQFAFRNPRVAKQTVLNVRFDQAGNVASIRRTG